MQDEEEFSSHFESTYVTNFEFGSDEDFDGLNGAELLELLRRQADGENPKSFGEWRVLQSLGKGAMGLVYKAARDRDLQQFGKVLQQLSALKIINPAFLARDGYAEKFVKEISHLNKVDSPFVAAFVDAGIQDNAPWYAARFVEGSNLEQVLKAKNKLSLFDWRELTGNMLRALRTAHAVGVVHRDIKPSNIVYSDASGSFTLVDFGLAIISDSIGSKTIGHVEGTPFYMAPEQYMGKFDKRSDVFSLGVTLFEALAGFNPIIGRDELGGDINMGNAVLKGMEATNNLHIDWSVLKDDEAQFLKPMLARSINKRPTAQQCFDAFQEWVNSGVCPDYGWRPRPQSDIVHAARMPESDFDEPGFNQAAPEFRELATDFTLNSMMRINSLESADEPPEKSYEDEAETLAKRNESWRTFEQDLQLLFDVRGVKNSSMAIVNKNGESLALAFTRTRGYEVLVTVSGSKAIAFNQQLLSAGWLRRGDSNLEMRVSGTNLNNMVTRTRDLVVRTIREDLQLDLNRIRIF